MLFPTNWQLGRGERPRLVPKTISRSSARLPVSRQGQSSKLVPGLWQAPSASGFPAPCLPLGALHALWKAKGSEPWGLSRGVRAPGPPNLTLGAGRCEVGARGGRTRVCVFM